MITSLQCSTEYDLGLLSTSILSNDVKRILASTMVYYLDDSIDYASKCTTFTSDISRERMEQCRDFETVSISTYMSTQGVWVPSYFELNEREPLAPEDYEVVDQYIRCAVAATKNSTPIASMVKVTKDIITHNMEDTNRSPIMLQVRGVTE